jgi:multiple sugar transport system permease protein
VTSDRRRAAWLPRGCLLTVVAIVGVTLYLFPIYWMFVSGLKTSAEIFANPPTLFPRQPSLAAFGNVFVRENVLRYLRNSLSIAVPVTLLTIVMGAVGGYALSRLRSRLVDAALFTVLMLQVFPDALLATPMFIIFKILGLLNTFAAVILATTSKTLAFALVILRPMFRQVPIELEEASLVDGCNRFQAFRRIVLPIMHIPLIVVGALSFVQAYGQFVYALTLLSRQELQPATVGIYSFVGAEYADWNRVMAFSSVFVLPIEGFVVHLLDGAAAEGGGVVDHDVEPAAGGGDLVDHGAGGVMVGHIDLPEDRLAAFGIYQAEGFLAMCGRASGNDDDGAFAREGDRDGAANALARAGDDGDFAGEAGAHWDVLSSQAATSMTTPLASKPWLARRSCCE